MPDIDRSETDLLVFISSVMTPDMEDARRSVRDVFQGLGFTRAWAFEYTPPSSESPDESYLRKVQDADFVVWLIGDVTTPPVSAEVNTCISSGRRLIAVKLPADQRDQSTSDLIALGA